VETEGPDMYNTYYMRGRQGIRPKTTARRKASDPDIKAENSATEPELYEAVLKGLNDAIFLHDLTPNGKLGKFIKLNRVACRMLGYTEQELLALSLKDLVPVERRSNTPAVTEQILQSEHGTFETSLITKDGRKIPIELRSELLELRGKRLLYLIARDVTERKQWQEALRRSGEQYRLLFNIGTDALIVFGLTHEGVPGKFIEVNQIACQLLGYDRDELLILAFLNIISPEQRADAGVLLEKLRSDRQVTTEILLQAKEGRRIPVELTAHLFLLQGELTVLATARDISNQRHAENVQASIYKISEAAHDAQNLEELFSSIHTIISDMMPANNFYIALYDSETEMLQFPYFVDEFDEPHPSRKGGKGLTEYVLRTGESLLAPAAITQELESKGELELIGSPSVDWLGVPLKTKEKIIGVLVVQSYTEGVVFGQDEKNILTFVSTQIASAIERKTAENALRENDERYRAFVKQSSEGIWRTQLKVPLKTDLFLEDQIEHIYKNSYVAEANDVVARMYGFDRADQLIGIPVRELHVYPDPQNIELLRQFIRSGYRLTDAESFELDRNGNHKYFLNNSIGILEEGYLLGVWGSHRDITERKKSEKDLRASEERYRAFLEQSSEAIWRFEMDQPLYLLCSEDEQIEYFYQNGYLAECNNVMAQMYGFPSAEEIIGARLGDMLLQSDPHNIEFLRAFIRSGYRLTDAESHEIDKGGNRKYFLNNLVGIVQNGMLIRIWGSQRDITERKRTEEALKASEERYRLLFERNLAGVYRSTPEGQLLDCNESFARILGYGSKEELLSQPISDVYANPADRETFVFRLSDQKALSNFENQLKRKDGSLLWVLENSSMIPGDIPGSWIIEGTLVDITDRKNAEQQISYQAYHDALTDLPNRNLFADRLNQALAHSLRHANGLAVLFLDLDHFKLINDTLGHSVGDWLLKEIAERLRKSVRELDTVARLGGDEFILLLPEIRNSEDAARVAQKILEVIDEPLHYNQNELYITTSIGISICPGDGTDAETLVRSADNAMYRAKELGRNNYQLSSASLNIRAQERLSWERDLRRAVERNEFVLYYQPQFHLVSGMVTGVEALIRWQHPEKGLVKPLDFIPLAEETRLIIPISEWVLRTACKQIKAWHQEGYSHLSVSLNLSARQFQYQNLVELIDQVLQENDLNPSCLILEITESVAMQNLDLTLAVLHTLKRKGVRIALDDFGVGYSSLSYLKHFPIDIIKIDPSFVRDVGTGLDEEALVRAVIHLGRSLKRSVIAEGVETEVQRAFLRYEGCEEMQGFLMSPPVPAEEARKFFQAAPI
jgi:diguanylate cyclase (GGDEF)-like protein/PAS domain S-box-containing protein